MDPQLAPPSTSHGSSIRLDRVTRSFAEVAAVAEVSLECAEGSFTALVGPSGCGKTTLLRLMGGLDHADRGTVTRESMRTSFCFQEPRLLPWRTTIENVALPLELAGVPRAQRIERANDALEQVQLSDAAQRFPHQLSGGMMMRASLARALVSRPQLLLLDEPFAALDEVTRYELDAQLRALWESQRFTAVIVTHSIPEAVFLAQRVLVFTPRPARIIAEVETPHDQRDAHAWTSDAIGTCVRKASDFLLAGISEQRR